MATVGWIVAVFAAIALGCVMVAGSLALFAAVLGKIEARGESRQHELERSRRLQDAWWFTEDMPTKELLDELATMGDVSLARERWRKRRKALPGSSS